MKIAVTGSAGFVGSWVVEAALVRGHAVTGLDRIPTKRYSGCELTLMQPARLADADAIIHCAAHADVRGNWEGRGFDQCLEDNLEATLRLLSCAQDTWTVGSFVFVSTGAVYAAYGDYDVSEADHCRATSPYAASKLSCEAYVQAYAERCGWRWYVLRPGACYGRGYHHGHIADFVGKFNAYGKISTIGPSIDQPGVHVLDLAEALVSMATDDAPSGIYNVSAGDWSYVQTIGVMSEMLGSRVSWENDGRLQGWLGANRGAHMNSNKLATLGLNPKRSIESGVREALASLGWAQ